MAKRKVYFYRADVGRDDAGRPASFDAAACLSEIERLEFKLTGRYLEESDGAVLSAWPERSRDRLTFGRIRRHDLPQIEKGGKFSPLRISAESGIVEQTFFRFFDHNVVGMLFNFYGPRASRLAWYLRMRAGEFADGLTFAALLRHDVLEQLDQLREIKAVEFTLRKSMADVLDHINEGVGSSLEAAAEALNADRVEVAFKPKKYKRSGWLSENLIEPLKDLAEDPAIRDNADKFRVKGRDADTGQLTVIDVLKDQFIIEKNVELAPGRTRAVAATSAYSAITSAYEELREQLNTAAALG